jgi:hypothetical protein
VLRIGSEVVPEMFQVHTLAPLDQRPRPDGPIVVAAAGGSGHRVNNLLIVLDGLLVLARALRRSGGWYRE